MTHSIPENLLAYATHGHRQASFGFWLMAKEQCPDGSGCTTINKKEFAKAVGCTLRTVRNRLHSMVEAGYLRHDKQTGKYFIHSAERLCELLMGEKPSRRKIRIEGTEDIRDRFFTAIIGQANKVACRKKVKQTESLYTGMREATSDHRFGTSASYIAKYAEYSRSWAQKNIKRVADKGLVEIQTRSDWDEFTPEQVRQYRSISVLCELVRHHRIVLVDGVERVVRRLSNVLIPQIHFETRKTR